MGNYSKELAALEDALSGFDVEDWQSQFAIQEVLKSLYDCDAVCAKATEAHDLMDSLFEDESKADEIESKVTEISQFIIGELKETEDDDILDEFLSNNITIGDELSGMVVDWESSNSDEILGSIKRKIHTLKGEAGVLSLSKLTKVCHSLEDVVVSDKPNTDELLKYVDKISGLFLEMTTGEINNAPTKSYEAEKDSEKEESEEVIDLQLQNPFSVFDNEMPLPEEAEAEMVAEFLEEASEHITNIEESLLECDNGGYTSDIIDMMFRGVHTMKGLAGFMGLNRIQKLAHTSEDLLDAVRDDRFKLSENHITALFTALDFFRKLFVDLLSAVDTGTRGAMPGLSKILMQLEKMSLGIDEDSSGDGDKEELNAQEDESQPKLGELLVESGAVSEEDISVAVDKQKETGEKIGEILVTEGKVSDSEVNSALTAQKNAGKTIAASTMKVEVSNIEDLGNAIGELVIAQNMLKCSGEIINGSRQLQSLMTDLDRITRSVQDMTTKLRMVQISPVFKRMNRVVRDLSKKISKKINFISEGDEIEIDKTLVDSLSDPLVHLVRNSADHGLESNAERLELGKAEAGNITLKAFRKSGQIHIEIVDDGKGLNREVIVKKAIEKKLIQSDDGMTDEDVWNLILLPGFSTAAKITDVSGRGVGMDVVKRMVEGMRGQIRIRSSKNIGTTVTLIFPLTLAIIDGMLVQAGGNEYIIPTLSVISSSQKNDSSISSLCDTNKLYDYQGRQIPLLSLAKLLDLEGALEDKCQRPLIMIISDGVKEIALEVDAILGRQQVVLKSIDRGLPDILGIGGSSITGEGKVCLVIDILGIMSIAGQEA